MNLFIRSAVAAALALVAACSQPVVDSAESTAQAGETAGLPAAGLTDTRRERIEAFVAAYAAADDATYERWLLTHRTPDALAAAPMEARLQMFAQDAQRWGGLTTRSIEMTGPNTAVLRATPSAGGPDAKVTFEFDPRAGDRIAAMQIGVAVDLPQTWSNLDEFAAQVQRESGLPAVALGVLRGGDQPETAVAGRRRADRDERVERDDTFHWGSIAKSVTGTMLAALVRDGVLDWDTTVGDILGHMPMRDAYRQATLWQAMSHQAGFPEYMNFTREMVDAVLAKGGQSWTERRRNMVAQILMEPPLGAPGTVGRYSNAGVTVAGFMAETVTGKSWRELVQTHVFDAVGMDTAGFDWPAAEGRTSQPYGHFNAGGGYEVHDPRMMAELVAILDPAGNIRSSIADLLRYGALHLRAMRATQPGPDLAAIAELHRARPGAIPVNNETYTFGWGHHCAGFPDDVSCHWHNGGAGSFFAELRLFPDDDLVIAYAANAAEPAEAVSGDVMQALYGRYAGGAMQSKASPTQATRQ